MKHLLLLLLWVSGFSAMAGTITVINGNDAGPGSLRQAIADAADGDLIVFKNVTTILLSSGNLVISKNLTIDGEGITIKGRFAPLIKAEAGKKILLKNINFWENRANPQGAILNLTKSLWLQNCRVVKLTTKQLQKAEKKNITANNQAGLLFQKGGSRYVTIAVEPDGGGGFNSFAVNPGDGGGGGGGACSIPPTWYQDLDGDGYGNLAVSIVNCIQPTGYVINSGDCDDNNINIHPFATEVCDGKDNDCNGLIDDGVGTLWYRDADGDGYGNPTISILSCSQPAGFVSNSDDCDDTRSAINPQTKWYKDHDKDGYTNGTSIISCTRPMVPLTAPAVFPQIIETYKLITELSGGPGIKYDCDDNNPAVYPGAAGSTCLIICPTTNILYVKFDATGANDGSSWTNALTKLQDAVFQACPGITQIWVAKGTYYTDEGGGKVNNDRNASFIMKNNLAIYGGFNGTETQLNERNWTTNPTILSGDIDQNDGANFANNSGNSYCK